MDLDFGLSFLSKDECHVGVFPTTKHLSTLAPELGRKNHGHHIGGVSGRRRWEL